MTILSVSGIGLSFGTVSILDNVGFSVNEGDRLGVIGVNGAGKTSLFRIIAGEQEPTSGSVYLAKDKTLGVLRQDEAVTAASPTQTVYDYMLAAFPELLRGEEELAALEAALLAASAEEAPRVSQRLEECRERHIRAGGLEFRARSRAMCRRLGFTEEELDGPVLALSGGQHTRLALSRLLCREPDVLMLDEPTNHLDIDALSWLEEFLAAYRKTVLVISHDRYFLDRVTTKTLHIEYHRARLYPGNYSRARLQMAEEAAAQEKAYKEQQKEIAKIEANIEFQRRCGQEHNFVTIRSKEKQLEHMEKVEKVKAPPKEIRFSFQSEDSVSQDVVKAEALRFSYGGEPLFSHLSFLIRRKERVLFLGPNGCGKSTLMKILSGKLAPQSGKLDFGYQCKIGYYDQATAQFDESKTVFDELHDTYPQKTNTEIRSALALFLFGADDVSKRVSSLSGGERARLTLCRLMLSPVNLLLLDEPTNHLDIGSREALETALAAFDGTVVAVSHDRYFIDRVATRVIEMREEAEGGALTYAPMEGEGAYECYLRHHEAPAAAAPKSDAPSDAKAAREEQKRRAHEERAAATRRQKAETRAGELEKEIAEIKAELFGPAASDYVRAGELQAKLDACEEELLSLYELLL